MQVRLQTWWTMGSNWQAPGQAIDPQSTVAPHWPLQLSLLHGLELIPPNGPSAAVSTQMFGQSS